MRALPDSRLLSGRADRGRAEHRFRRVLRIWRGFWLETARLPLPDESGLVRLLQNASHLTTVVTASDRSRHRNRPRSPVALTSPAILLTSVSALTVSGNVLPSSSSYWPPRFFAGRIRASAPASPGCGRGGRESHRSGRTVDVWMPVLDRHRTQDDRGAGSHTVIRHFEQIRLLSTTRSIRFDVDRAHMTAHRGLAIFGRVVLGSSGWNCLRRGTWPPVLVCLYLPCCCASLVPWLRCWGLHGWCRRSTSGRGRFSGVFSSGVTSVPTTARATVGDARTPAHILLS